MIKTRRSRILTTVSIVVFLYVVSRAFFRKGYQDEIRLDGLSEQVINKEIRQAASHCNTKFLSQDRPANCKGKPLLLILISSSPNRLSHRNMLRRLLQPEMENYQVYSEGPLWKVVFVVSKTNNLHLELKVKKEIETYQDIVWSRFRETQSTLIFKTLVGFSWAYCHCQPKYIMKMNEDAFLNLKILVHWLLTNRTGDLESTRVYTGLKVTVKVPRENLVKESSTRVLEAKEETPLPAIMSSGYLTSFDVLLNIFPLFPHFRAFSIDDAYIAFLIKETGVKAINNARFHEQAKTNFLRVCDYRRIFISLNVLADDFPKMFEESTRSEKECMPKITLFSKNKGTSKETKHS